jgi:hypothetical protein
MTTVRPLLDHCVGALYRVRLYAPTDADLVAVAEPLVEERYAAEAATLLWDRHVAPRTQRLEWVEVLEARRPRESRAPLVVQLHITRDAGGQLHLNGWRRVAWAEVERRCGSPIPLAPRMHPLPAHRPLPLVPVARASQPAPQECPAPTGPASRWPWPTVPDALRALTPQRADDALA